MLPYAIIGALALNEYGMVAPHRAKDLVDVQELINSAGLPRETADELDPWVRAKFLELWELARIPDPF